MILVFGVIQPSMRNPLSLTIGPGSRMSLLRSRTFLPHYLRLTSVVFAPSRSLRGHLNLRNGPRPLLPEKFVSLNTLGTGAFGFPFHSSLGNCCPIFVLLQPSLYRIGGGFLLAAWFCGQDVVAVVIVWPSPSFFTAIRWSRCILASGTSSLRINSIC